MKDPREYIVIKHNTLEVRGPDKDGDYELLITAEHGEEQRVYLNHVEVIRLIASLR